MKDKGFTVICNNCGAKVTFTKDEYDKEADVKINSDYGGATILICEKCDQWVFEN